MLIYGLTDPINHELRYVGFTTKSLSERLRGHLKNQSLRKHTHKNFWIKTLLKKSLKPYNNFGDSVFTIGGRTNF